MDETTLVDTVTDDLETELSRLGSSKWLYALTGGEMTGDAVRAAAAADADAAAERFETWAADAEGEGEAEAATLFESLATTAADRREAVDADPADADRRTHGTLAGLDGTASRLGGALGYALVTDRTLGQMVGFFVGDADPSTADTFRDLRSEAAADRDRIVATLDSALDGGDDWDRARSAATAVVEAAYEEYVETLQSMGIEPKNVC
ncbi:transcription antitermination protein [Haloplanus halophilus]|uniref:transcription antitermination protein n=1 Tax=Haloplanus halophilus TaxID=2949993 RepID=UPI00203BA975|nr:transcription antitermination protein [Haloplanus sp. GDY1]